MLIASQTFYQDQSDPALTSHPQEDPQKELP